MGCETTDDYHLCEKKNKSYTINISTSVKRKERR